MSYPTERLGNYIEILSGFAFKSKDFSQSGIPVIKIKNVTPPSVSLTDISYVPEEIAERNAKFKLQYNDVLIALTGSHVNQMASVVGRVARVKYSNITVLNQRVGKITVIDDDECDLDFVYYYLSQNKVKIELASKAGGAANQANISPTDIKNLMVPFPEICTQRKIASILRAYDDLIENNQKQIKLLEEAAQRLYKEWFVDLRFPGHETTPIVDGVPEGWNAGALHEICTLKKCTVSADLISANTPYIGLEHMPRADFCLSSWGNAENVTSNKFRYTEDDIIFGKIRPYFHKVGFALNTGVVSTDSFVMEAKKGLWGLLLMTVFDKAFIDYTYQTSKEGAKMPRADWKQMEKYPVLIPGETIRREFENFIWKVTRRVKTLSLQNHTLEEARDRLLPKLMNGEIEV